MPKRPRLRVDMEPIAGEEWRLIRGHEGYEVSDHGRVRSWWTAGGGSGSGHGGRAIGAMPKITIGSKQRSGHLVFEFGRRGGSGRHTVGVHVLVLEAFVGPRPDGLFCCHNDGDPGNNRLENLRWDTRSANNIDILRHGGQRHCVLTEADIPSIWARMVSGEATTNIARDMNLSIAALNRVRCGQGWTHITSNLPGWPLAKDTDHHDKKPIYCEARGVKTEIWRPIPGYPNYRISSRGNLESNRGGKSWRAVLGTINRDGHRSTLMTNLTGHKKHQRFHQLVLTAFACPRPRGYVGCHTDGNPLNNCVDNLRWDSVRSNVLDRWTHAKSRNPAAD